MMSDTLKDIISTGQIDGNSDESLCIQIIAENVKFNFQVMSFDIQKAEFKCQFLIDDMTIFEILSNSIATAKLVISNKQIAIGKVCSFGYSIVNLNANDSQETAFIRVLRDI